LKKLTKVILILLAFYIVFLGCEFSIKKMYPMEYYNIVATNSEKYEVDPLMIMSIIRAESGFDEKATSTKSARGLMQIREDTATWCADCLDIDKFNIQNLYNPDTNILLGTWYFHSLMDEYNGDTRLCIAAYNAGTGNVKKWLKNPEYSADGKTLTKIPFPETEKYINKVMNNYKIYNKLYKTEDKK